MESGEGAGLNPEANAMGIFKKMLSMVPGMQNAIDKLILVGDSQTWLNTNKVVMPIMQSKICTDMLYVDKQNNCAGGVDVSLNPRRQMVFIQRCTDTKKLVFQRPYKEIQGQQFEMT